MKLTIDVPKGFNSFSIYNALDYRMREIIGTKHQFGHFHMLRQNARGSAGALEHIISGKLWK